MHRPESTVNAARRKFDKWIGFQTKDLPQGRSLENQIGDFKSGNAHPNSRFRRATVLRMRLAVEWIGRDHISIGTAAERLGHGSQAAFSRAFKRVTGRPPGATRS